MAQYKEIFLLCFLLSGLTLDGFRRSLRLQMGGAEDVLRRGLLQGLGGSDALQRARSLVSPSVAEAASGMWGSPILTNLEWGDKSAEKLERAGAILLTLSSDSYEGRSLLRNPRDDRFALTGSSADSLVSAVVLGLGRLAVISTTENVEAQRAARAISWAGASAIGANVDGRRIFLVGSSISELLPLAAALDVSPESALRDDGAPVAFSVSGSPLAFPHGGVCEQSVATSMSVLSEVLKRVATPAATTVLADVLCCPAVPSASQLAGSDALRAITEEEKLCIADWLGGRVCVLLPCGVVCEEDDGYGSAAGGEGDREGLPIGALLHAPAASPLPLLQLATAYEHSSRWSSELFATAASREQAKEDLDDARESFGIFFTSTLIKYIGKRVAK